MESIGEQVVVDLCDFSRDEIPITLSKKFRLKLLETQWVSFSSNFEQKEEIEIVGGGDPLDIVISHKHSLVIVSVTNQNDRILAFDLESRKLRGCLKKASISNQCLCLEENYDMKGNEALYVSVNKKCIEKYDLKSLVTKQKDTEEVEPLWRSEYTDEIYGMCVNQNKNQEEGFLYACGKFSINQFRASDGKLIKFDFLSCREPWGVRLTRTGEFLYSVFGDGKVEKKKQTSNGSWNNELTINTGLYVAGVFIDETNQNIIVCEGDSVTLFSSLGVKIAQCAATNVKGCFLNQKTGELFVAQCEDNKIVVFK